MELSIIDANSPIIVESKLRNSLELQERLHRFYTTSSPSFRDFRAKYQLNIQSGIGIDMHLQHVYDEFSALVEEHISSILNEIHVSNSNFVFAVNQLILGNDQSAISLLKYTHSESNMGIFEFGLMMELKYKELYESIPTTIHTNNDSKLDPSNIPQHHVRVVWDIENIPISKKIGGLNAITKLKGFLHSKGLEGPGIDTRITVFFNPEKSRISAKVVRELDHASVEMVWVSSKREDADRKLGTRIIQEIDVLTNPTITTFVIISSDQDFRHHIQILSQKGYRTIILHNATNRKWRQSLVMNASEEYLWSEIVGEEGFHNRTMESSVHASASESYGECDIPIAVPITSDQGIESTNNEIRTSPQLNSKAIGWVNAKCIRWRGAYGFLAVEKSLLLCLVENSPSKRQDLLSYFHSVKNIIKQSDMSVSPSNQFLVDNKSTDVAYSSAYGGHGAGTVRVYCHHSSLSEMGCIGDIRRSLNRGESVNALVELGDRGLRSVNVIRSQV